MNKVVIIAGCARTGKTTLARRFRKLGFNHYKMDTIKRGIDNNFINKKYKLWSSVSGKMTKLIERIIVESREDATYEDNYVIDTCHVLPKDLAKLNLDNTVIIFLGYPNINIKEKINNIRKYDKDFMWSSTKDDNYFLKATSMDINFSKRSMKECQKYNIKFFDTSKDFKKTLDEAYKYINERLGD